MVFNHYLGVDVGKSNLDLHLRDKNGTVSKIRIANTSRDLKGLRKDFHDLKDFSWETTLVCMEHTGVYMNHLLVYLLDQKTNIWVEKALQIKKSLGMTRGKDDQVDAERIANYCFRFQDKVKIWKPMRQQLIDLKKLSNIRRQLLKVKDQLQRSLQEANGHETKQLYKLEKTHKSPVIQKIEQQIKVVDKSIACILKEDKHLDHLSKQITSVTGVGKVTATAIIVATNEFEYIREGKKFACYTGVVPYPNSSGTSRRGKERVSHLANKQIKTLLHMCALSAIQVPGEIQNYYQKKVAEGKNKMMVINAVRNKLIHRIFAVVRDNRVYQKNYQYHLIKP